MMKQMKKIANQTLFGAQEIKAYMKRATLTSFGITMGLFTSAFAIGMWIASFTETIIVEPPEIKPGVGITNLGNFKEDIKIPDLNRVPIDILTTIVEGTKKVAGNFVAVPDMSIAIDASSIAGIDQMAGASSTLGDTDIEDVLSDGHVVFGDPEDFVIDETVIPAPKEEVFEVWEVTEQPNVDIEEISKNIVYPSIAKKAGIEGLVLINVLIGPDGKIAKLKVEHSDNLLLNEAAKRAVENSTYTPAIQNGKTCSCWLSIPIEFKLN